MKLTTAKMKLGGDQASIKNIELKEIIVRGGQLSYKSIKHVVSAILIATVFFLYYVDHSLMRVSYIIYLLLHHLDSTFVDHLSFHLSTSLIRHPLWFSVSRDSQGNTVQESSQYKCG